MEDQPTDAELVQQAKEAPEHFAAIYERFVGKIYSYVYYRTGDERDAEDLTARVFVQAMNHLPRYRERGVPLSAWLYRIAHNLLANWRRDNGRRTVVPLEDHVTHANLQSEAPESVTESREENAELLAAVRALPPDRQQLVILKFVERLSNAQIGKIMGRSEGAVKSLYHRTLLALRDTMGSNPDNPNPDAPGSKKKS